MRDRPWTEEELRLLRTNYRLGAAFCATLLPGRTKAAILSRARFDGLATPLHKWRQSEDETIVRHYPDYQVLKKLLTGRTLSAIKTRVKTLGVQRRLKLWTGAAVRRLVVQASQMSLREVYEANPDRCRESIRQYLVKAGAMPPKAYASSGIELLDQLRERCLDRGMSFRALGRMLGTIDALYVCGHRGCQSLEAQWTERAVNILDGELYVEWED